MNILFVCSRNQWRSKTAEDLFKNHSLHHVKSAGTAKSARVKVNERLLQWANTIFVMEKKHKQIIAQKFSHAISNSNIIVLNIPDEYQYMDAELVEILKSNVNDYLDS